MKNEKGDKAKAKKVCRVKRKTGRPSWIPPDLAQVEEIARTQLSARRICEALGICWDTLAKRKRDFSGFSDAIARGRARGASQAANVITELMNDRTIESSTRLKAATTVLNACGEEFLKPPPQKIELSTPPGGVQVHVKADLAAELSEYAQAIADATARNRSAAAADGAAQPVDQTEADPKAG